MTEQLEERLPYRWLYVAWLPVLALGIGLIQLREVWVDKWQVPAHLETLSYTLNTVGICVVILGLLIPCLRGIMDLEALDRRKGGGRHR